MFKLILRVEWGISKSIIDSRSDKGMGILCNTYIRSILMDGKKVIRMELENGIRFYTDYILSNSISYHIFIELLSSDKLPSFFIKHIQNVNYTSLVIKINVALNKLPNFTCFPTETNSKGKMIARL